jgi:hypothetical protein
MKNDIIFLAVGALLPNNLSGQMVKHYSKKTKRLIKAIKIARSS